MPETPVPMVPVASSNLKEVGYRSDTKDLHVAFKRGDTYVHAGVPPEVHDALMKASSHGKYYNENIKGRYPQYRLEKPNG